MRAIQSHIVIQAEDKYQKSIKTYEQNQAGKQTSEVATYKMDSVTHPDTQI